MTLLFASLLSIFFSYVQARQIISTLTDPCYASIGALYLNDSTGQALIIEAGNSDPGIELYDYPGFKVYIYNDTSKAYDIFYGQTFPLYYGLASDSGQIFKVISDGTNPIQRGTKVQLKIELWKGTTFDNFGCEFRFNGRLTMKDAPIYSTETCPASIDGVYFSNSSTPNSTGNAIIIEATNNDFRNEIFSYPGWKIYNSDNEFLGKEKVNYYGINQQQKFEIDLNVTNGNITVPQPGLQSILYLELWTGFYDTFSCRFEWNQAINVLTLAPTESPVMTTTTDMPTIDPTTEPTEVTRQPTLSPESFVYCDEVSEGDDVSCGEGTCRCDLGAICEDNECVGWGNPNESGCAYFNVWRIFIVFLVCIVIM